MAPIWHYHMILECVYEPSTWSRASFSLSFIKIWKKNLELAYESSIAGALIMFAKQWEKQDSNYSSSPKTQDSNYPLLSLMQNRVKDSS